MAPVQVRLSGAADDLRRLAEFLAGLQEISASPADIRHSGSSYGMEPLAMNVWTTGMP